MPLWKLLDPSRKRRPSAPGPTTHEHKIIQRSDCLARRAGYRRRRLRQSRHRLSGDGRQVPAAGSRGVFHTENGVLGFGEAPPEGREDWDLINAGKKAITLKPGASFFHHADSFA